MQTEAATLGTCPLWYFNNSTGIWQEEGQGTYNASSASFVGNVSHFSTWNYDIMYPRAFISGRVVDSNGVPVQGAQVKCWGIGWYMQRWASGETVTNDNGVFTKIPVEVGVTFKYQASKGGHESAVLQAGPLTQNEEFNVGDIILDAPLIQITLTWGENPRDLDSHLAANLTSGITFHVYYSTKVHSPRRHTQTWILTKDTATVQKSYPSQSCNQAPIDIQLDTTQETAIYLHQEQRLTSWSQASEYTDTHRQERSLQARTYGESST